MTFVGGNEEDARLWIRSLDSVTPHPLTGTDGADGPFWSPDGRFIAFGAGGKLRRVAVSGGPVHTVCDARLVSGGTWNRDDVIIFTPNNQCHSIPSGGRRRTDPGDRSRPVAGPQHPPLAALPSRRPTVSLSGAKQPAGKQRHLRGITRSTK